MAWTVGGVGMGLAMASVAVLTLQLSPPQDQGANSAALQVSDSLFSAVTIGVGGAVYALGLRWDDGAWALRLIYAVMVALAVLGVVVAGRVRPGSTGGGRTAGCGERRAASRPRVTVSCRCTAERGPRYYCR